MVDSANHTWTTELSMKVELWLKREYLVVVLLFKPLCMYRIHMRSDFISICPIYTVAQPQRVA